MTVPQGVGRRPTSAPGMIRTTGRNHTWSAPMTDMQREMAEAPLERVRVAALEPWWVSLMLWIGVIAAGCCIPLYFIAFGVGHGH